MSSGHGHYRRGPGSRGPCFQKVPGWAQSIRSARRALSSVAVVISRHTDAHTALRDSDPEASTYRAAGTHELACPA